ncbi:hypothetical protein EB796_005123 [Bugula neritina]|uniref:Uncharacterized protein n=1 Tax=Bugula neritina TaxID=10212 RepID=A0A7J7KE47_BUGNE|nr:hypothetical protein EB796_005123 [Bugula neritina]
MIPRWLTSLCSFQISFGFALVKMLKHNQQKALLLSVGEEEVAEVCEQIEAFYPSTVTLEPSCTSALYRVFRVEVSGGNGQVVPDPTAASASIWEIQCPHGDGCTSKVCRALVAPTPPAAKPAMPDVPQHLTLPAALQASQKATFSATALVAPTPPAAEPAWPEVPLPLILPAALQASQETTLSATAFVAPTPSAAEPARPEVSLPLILPAALQASQETTLSATAFVAPTPSAAEPARPEVPLPLILPAALQASQETTLSATAFVAPIPPPAEPAMAEAAQLITPKPAPLATQGAALYAPAPLTSQADPPATQEPATPEASPRVTPQAALPATALAVDDAVPAGLDGMVSLVCSLYETDTEAAPALLLSVGEEEVAEVCEQIEAFYPSTVTLEPSCTSALYRVFRVEVSGGNGQVVPDPTAASVAPANLSRDLQPHLVVLLHVVLQYSQAVCPQPSAFRMTSSAPCCWIAFSYKPSVKNLKPLGLKTR